MEENEKLPLFVSLKEHFHVATEGDMELLWRRLSRFSLADAKWAIEEHHLERGAEAYRPDINRISELTLSRREKLVSPQLPPKIVEELRQYKPSAFVGMTDEEVILTNARQAWESRPGSMDEIGSVAMRRMLIGQARLALEEIGINPGSAYMRAREAVGMKPGEVLPRPKFFHEPPAPVQSVDALKQLAIAERGITPSSTEG